MNPLKLLVIMVAAGFARVTLFLGSYQDAIAIVQQS